MKALALLLLLSVPPVAAQMAFYPLGYLDGYGPASEAYAVSADGSRIVGYSGTSITENQACWWTTAGIAPLGAPHPQDWYNNAATDVAADGSVIVGYNSWGGTERAFYHIVGSDIVEIPMPPPPAPATDFQNSCSLEVSDNGQVVVGSATYWAWYGIRKVYYQRSFVWSPGQAAAILLPQRPGDFKSDYPFGVNHDGSLVVGSAATSTTTERACYWTAAGGPFLFSQPTDSLQTTSANGVTPDGSVVVGAASDSSTKKAVAFKWTPGTGAVVLPNPTTGYYEIKQATALSVSGDGRVVVGFGKNAIDEEEAIVWVAMQPYLVSHVAYAGGVLPFDGTYSWEPWRAYGVDFYGNTICGFGKAISGKIEGYALILDETPAPPVIVAPEVQPHKVAANGDFTISWFARPGLRYRVMGSTSPGTLAPVHDWTNGQGNRQSYTATAADTGGADAYFLAVEVRND